MDRTHGRAPSGVRGDGPVPYGHWKVVTLTAAIRLGGVPEPARPAFDGATHSAAFGPYNGRVLAPSLRPGGIVIMDNLACHKVAEVDRLIAGAGVRYLPVYSPDPNPIERMFSKLKAYLRSSKARAFDGLIEAMGMPFGRSGPATSWAGFAIADMSPRNQQLHSIENRSNPTPLDPTNR
jgi:transposase